MFIEKKVFNSLPDRKHALTSNPAIGARAARAARGELAALKRGDSQDSQ